jgi:hypothetical protein
MCCSFYCFVVAEQIVPFQSKTNNQIRMAVSTSMSCFTALQIHLSKKLTSLASLKSTCNDRHTRKHAITVNKPCAVQCIIIVHHLSAIGVHPRPSTVSYNIRLPDQSFLVELIIGCTLTTLGTPPSDTHATLVQDGRNFGATD